MRTFILLIFLFSLSVGAQTTNAARFCIKFDFKTFSDKKLLRSSCKVTQKLTYQDNAAKWTCVVNGKTLMADVFYPAAVGYDYNRNLSYVSYVYERSNSPFYAMLKKAGLTPAGNFQSFSPNKIYFSKSGPLTFDTVLFIQDNEEKYELSVQVSPKYLSQSDTCN